MLRALPNVPLTLVVVRRARGAVYWVGGPERTRGLPSPDRLRPLARDARARGGTRIRRSPPVDPRRDRVSRRQSDLRLSRRSRPGPRAPGIRRRSGRRRPAAERHLGAGARVVPSRAARRADSGAGESLAIARAPIDLALACAHRHARRRRRGGIGWLERARSRSRVLVAAERVRIVALNGTSARSSSPKRERRRQSGLGAVDQLQRWPDRIDLILSGANALVRGRRVSGAVRRAAVPSGRGRCRPRRARPRVFRGSSRPRRRGDDPDADGDTAGHAGVHRRFSRPVG